MKKLDTFQGHIVLLCKGHYKTKDFFEALGQIWAIRCGWDYKYFNDKAFEYVADDMYRIIALTEPNRLEHLFERIHKGLANQAFYKPKKMSPIKALIWEYRSILNQLQIKEKPEGKKFYKTLVSLPNRQVRIFNRILSGEGEYKDHERITKADKRKG